MALYKQDTTMENATSNDVVIMVMGMTGAGKSTFISSLVGHDDIAGHDLSSYTQGVEFYSVELSGRMVHFVDTPGFNDTWRSDLDLLKQIAFILSQIYRRRINLAGILYLHRISDNRVTGSAMKNFDLLSKICGFEAASRVMLITSMWKSDQVGTRDYREAVMRESSLISTEEFWGGLCQYGSQTRRWQLGDSSAMSIVEELLEKYERSGAVVLKIQKELVDESKQLNETTAGAKLSEEYDYTERKLLGEVDSAYQSSALSRYDIADTTSAMRKEIEEIRNSQKQMRMSLSTLIAEKEKAYAKALEQMQQEQQKLAKELEESREKRLRLEADIKMNAATLRNERLEWKRRREQLEYEEYHGRRSAESLAIERQEIDDEESIFDDELQDNKRERDDMSSNADRLRKREIMKRNIIPFLGVLAGTGISIAGVVTGLVPLAMAGAGFALERGSHIDLSRTNRVYERSPGMASTGTLVSGSGGAFE